MIETILHKTRCHQVAMLAYLRSCSMSCPCSGASNSVSTSAGRGCELRRAASRSSYSGLLADEKGLSASSSPGLQDQWFPWLRLAAGSRPGV